MCSVQSACTLTHHGHEFLCGNSLKGALDGDFALVLAGGLAIGLLDEHAAGLGLVDLCDSMQALVAGPVTLFVQLLTLTRMPSTGKYILCGRMVGV